jgi:predicted cobalt transporter CbtA
MQFKLWSDLRISALFLILLVFGPVITSQGFSIVMFALPGILFFSVNAQVAVEGSIWLVIDFVVALVLSNVIFWLIDKRGRRAVSSKRR